MDNAPKDKSDSQAASDMYQVLERRYSIRRAREFVNRNEEQKLVASRVEQLLQNIEVTECVLDFYGVPGIGKSAFLAHISDQWRCDERIRVLELDLEAVFSGYTAIVPRLQFLQAVAQTALLPEVDHTLITEITKIENTEDDQVLDGMLQRVAQAIIERGIRLLIIFDAWDRVPDVFPPWIERLFIKPLIQANRAVALFGSQLILRWWQFEVRRRTCAYSLQPLSHDETARQIGVPGELGQRIHALTGGYPLANEYFYGQLAQVSSPDTLLDTKQPDLLTGIVDAVYSRIVDALSNELRRVVGVMVLFREFDVSTLRAILPRFYTEFASRSQSSLLLSMKELLATRLVSWSETLRAYRFDPIIRHIFSQSVAINTPGVYLSIRNAAIDYYSTLIAEVPGSRDIYLAEYCYHALYKASAETYNEEALSSNIEGIRGSIEVFLQKYYLSSGGREVLSSPLDALLQRLDADAELRQALLARQYPAGFFSDIVRAFRDHDAGAQSRAASDMPQP